jgi:hypothetical protein
VCNFPTAHRGLHPAKEQYQRILRPAVRQPALFFRERRIVSGAGLRTPLIAEAVAVMEFEGTVEHLMFTIHAHPTLSEAMLDGFAGVEGLAINA